MKWTKTRYDLTLNEVSRMLELNDYTVLKRFAWVPPWVLRRAMDRFAFDLSEMFNTQQIEGLLSSDIMRLKIANRANVLLPALYYGLLLTGDDRFIEMFRQMYGRDPKSVTDLDVIIKEIKRLGGKLRELDSLIKDDPGGRRHSFEEIITTVEAILERNIDRSMRLYQFKYQFDLSVKRAKELEKLRK